MIVVHVDVAVSLEKHIQNILCMVVWSCLCSACFFKLSDVICEYMLHPGWALYKSTKITYDNQCCNERKTKTGILFLVLGNVGGEIAL